MDVCVYDMLSILLQARSYDPTDYKVGMKILFSMATGKAVEKQTLIYRGKENFTSENGTTYRCLVFSLVEYVDNKEKEVITFFVTDDLNHLPVRLDMYLNFLPFSPYINQASSFNICSTFSKKSEICAPSAKAWLTVRAMGI